jgi:hypothetical protein
VHFLPYRVAFLGESGSCSCVLRREGRVTIIVIVRLSYSGLELSIRSGAGEADLCIAEDADSEVLVQAVKG